MKKIIFGVAVMAVALLASCSGNKKETVTLDLTKTTTPAEVTFDDNGLWTGVYDSSIPYIVAQGISFQHYGETGEWGKWYMGFTLCNNSEADKSKPESNIAGGARAGKDKPYLIAYWGDYNDYTTGAEVRTCDILFPTDGKYEPKSVYVCNMANVVDILKNGQEGAYVNARAFKDGDYFLLKVCGLNEKKEKLAGSAVEYYLADFRDGKTFINEDWAKIDLTGLGACSGLTFVMETTDTNEYGNVTPTYFALDGLTVEYTSDKE